VTRRTFVTLSAEAQATETVPTRAKLSQGVLLEPAEGCSKPILQRLTSVWRAVGGYRHYGARTSVRCQIQRISALW
jgi:hypothetical protein